MKLNKIKMIISTVLIFLPSIIGFIFIDDITAQIAIHWGIDGQPDGYASALGFFTVMPIILAMINIVCFGVTLATNKNNEQNKKVTEIVYWICPAISIFSFSIIYCSMLGRDINISYLACILFGLMFCIVGNYMPKCKQNSTMGVKIRWTLTNEENWNATHRFAGKAWFFGGVILLLFAFIPSEVGLYFSLGGMIAVAMLPMIYSYAYYRKQLKAGAAKEDFQYPKRTKTQVLAATFSISTLLIFLLIIMFTGNIRIHYTESDEILIDATYWTDTTIEISEIKSVEYRESVKSTRVNGFASARLLLGYFQSEELGNHTRLTYTSCKSAVVIKTDNSTYVINRPDEAQTKGIYEEIVIRTGTEADQ